MMLPERRDRALISLPGRRFRQAERHTHFDLAGAIQRHSEHEVRVPANERDEIAPQFLAQAQLLRP